ncbi:MAG: tetratricopeptide repeat-containing sensor histidine kinase [Bacteroidales bacterium]|nr:tetratricopeptide repeat-containing sensor histidine kinase [Bacteroidales bacterium]MBN2818942.1 tetratricopeptide repeat-containing sensor histidine kinase [Bacteroidales bacterium]
MRRYFIYFIISFLLYPKVFANSNNWSDQLDLLLTSVKSNSNSDPSTAINLCDMGIELSRQYADSIALVDFMSWKGRTYSIMADHVKALELLIDAEKMASAIGYEAGEAFAVMSQGNVFYYHKLFGEALIYYKNAMIIAQGCNDKNMITSLYHNFGVAYLNGFDMFDTSLIYLKTALKGFEELKDTSGIAFTYYNIGSNYHGQKDFEKSLFYLKKAIKSEGRYIGKAFYGDALITMGDIYFNQNRPDSAEKLLLKGIECVKETNTLFYLERGFKILGILYARHGKIRDAYSYTRLATELIDSVNKKELTDKIAFLSTIHELELKEQEIKVLKTESQLAQELYKKQKFRIRISLLVVLLLVVILVLGIKQFQTQKQFNSKLKQQVKEQTEILEEALEQVKESDELKTQFLQNVSHEVRTPINAIHGFSDIMCNEENLDPLFKEYAWIITKNTDYLIELFDNITDITRLEKDNYFIEIKDFKLMDVVSELITKYQSRAFNKHAGKVEILSELININDDTSIKTDKNNLYRILYNLMDNALKFTIEGSVKLYIEKLSDSYIFKVIDTGVGIPDEYKYQIYDKFVKFNPLKDKYTRGSGLGLAITKLLVEKLKGQLWFENNQDRGTSFIVKLKIL